MNRSVPLRANKTFETKVAVKRKCTVCKQDFRPARQIQKVCGPKCAQVAGTAKADKQRAKAASADRKETKQRLESMKPLSHWRSKARTALHAYVRARDEGKPCASCDTILVKAGRPGGDYDAGHFRSVGSAKHLEMDVRNIHGQCKHCNKHLAGNPLEYERRLRLRYGDRMVDELLADNAPRQYRKEDYQAIEVDAKAWLKDLKK